MNSERARLHVEIHEVGESSADVYAEHLHGGGSQLRLVRAAAVGAERLKNGVGGASRRIAIGVVPA